MSQQNLCKDLTEDQKLQRFSICENLQMLLSAMRHVFTVMTLKPNNPQHWKSPASLCPKKA